MLPTVTGMTGMNHQAQFFFLWDGGGGSHQFFLNQAGLKSQSSSSQPPKIAGIRGVRHQHLAVHEVFPDHPILKSNSLLPFLFST
jgi:hypothetical protein